MNNKMTRFEIIKDITWQLVYARDSNVISRQLWDRIEYLRSALWRVC